MTDISIELLRQLLRYEPETGKLYWLSRDVSLFHESATRTAAGTCKWWNGRFAGKEAFTATGVHGCRAGRIFGQAHYAHRVAWALHHGGWPTDEIDHQDGDRANNRISNLREVMRQQEAGNTADLQDRNASRQTARELSAGLIKMDRGAQIQGAFAEAGAKAKTADSAAQREHEERMERIRNDGRIKQIIAQAKADGLKVASTEVDDDTGAVSVIFNNGTGMIVPNVIARRQPKSSAQGAGSSLLDQGGQLGTPPANRPPLSSFDR